MLRLLCLWSCCLLLVVLGQQEAEAEVLSMQLHPEGSVPEQAPSMSIPMHSRELQLPSFSNGGIVFFLHVPKTGGTTIRRNLETLERVHHVFAKNYTTYKETAPLVEDAIVRGTRNKTILFYEIHATDAPSFFRLRKRLRRWKDTAASNNVPVWFFTVLRDPLKYAVSHFNFFHVQKRNPTFEQCNATAEDFIRKSLYNPQCQFLFRGEPSMRAQQAKQIYITPEECESVHALLLDLFDWVGITEFLSNETLPLLAQLFDVPFDFKFQRYRVSKEESNGAYFDMQNATLSALASITTMSTLDSMIYESVKYNFLFSMWTGV